MLLFLLSEDKCQWNPTRIGYWLGHVLDFNVNKLFITEDRTGRMEISIKSMCVQLDKHGQVIPVRYIATIVGQIISLQSTIGKTVSLTIRYLYKCIFSLELASPAF